MSLRSSVGRAGGVSCDSLEPRLLFVVVGADAGAAPQVSVFNANDGQLRLAFMAYDVGFRGGVRVAASDINGDGVTDIITAPGSGSSNVRVFDGDTGLQIAGPLGSFFAYDPGFTGGVFVAARDVNGDGRNDIITGAGPGAGPHVKVFDGITGNVLQSFYAYDPGFGGGVTVAAGDTNRDGDAEVVTGTWTGSSHVKVFDGATNELLQSYFAYDGYNGGIYVSSGDVNNDNRRDIITGTRVGSSHVKVFDARTGGLIRSFFAFDPALAGGVRLAGGTDVNNDGFGDIIVGTGPGGPPTIAIFSGRQDMSLLETYYAFDVGFLGGIYVGGGA